MKLLFISHRIPYPPNKGDKIRSYNVLRYLAHRHDVYLACLVDNAEDLAYLDALNPLVQDIVYDTISPVLKKIQSSLALLGSKPISIPYFYSRTLQSSIDRLLDKIDIETVYCSSSPTAEYLFRSRHYNGKLRRTKRVMDLIDVDSDKWRQYADTCRYPMRWVYQREAKRLLAYEAMIAAEFDHVLLVSETEKDFFLSNISTSNVTAMSNGVDLEKFSPNFRSTLQRKGPAIVFTGAMDYWPNIDAISWFVREVWHHVRKSSPAATLYIVGSKPSSMVQRLSRSPGVVVTGFVEDIRDYLSLADVCIAPLRIARGIQNKVLEAMAMAKPVVATEQAFEGIDARPGQDLLVTAAEPEIFAQGINLLWKDKSFAKQMGLDAREAIVSQYSWEKQLKKLNALLC